MTNAELSICIVTILKWEYYIVESRPHAQLHN